MNRRKVDSSHLASVGWEGEAEEGTLEVEFRSGFVYRYDKVPRAVYEALIGASSPGRYFSQNIDGAYEHRRA